MKFSRLTLLSISFVLFLMFLFAACNGDREPEDMQANRTAYQKNVQAKIDSLNLKVAKLCADYRDKEDYEQEVYEQHIIEFEGMRDTLQQKLTQLENSTEQEWNEMKQDVDEYLQVYERKVADYDAEMND
ncbi:MAG: hypothetical protein WAN36_13790 [Calditrichia bacterium]